MGELKLLRTCEDCPCLGFRGAGCLEHCEMVDETLSEHEVGQTVPLWCPLRKGSVTLQLSEHLAEGEAG
jgi:hypothetical protein